jgi:hypothetical protein
VARGTRYRLRKVSSSPFIYVRDLKPIAGQKKEWSLAPLERTKPEDVRLVADRIISLGDQPWPSEMGSSPSAMGWSEVIRLCEEDWGKRMKGSSSSHYRSALKQLSRVSSPRTVKAMKAWAMEKLPGSRPFLTRLETLSQLRSTLQPEWVPLELLEELRSLHKKGKSSRPSDLAGIRGIPTRAEAEAYLDGLSPAFQLERWCLAMMLCYGLRNHELWWCASLTTESPGITAGWTLIPGWWRTKSRDEHWVWPLYPEWIERYCLASQQGEAQEQLHRRVSPRLVSCRDKSRRWEPGDPADPGLCQNNHLIGNWIGRRLRTALPPWFARVPDTDGRYRADDKPKAITPYDLRHTWAVTMATDPEWRHVRDEDVARAMGHDIDVHRLRYQRWIGAEERRRRAMAAVIRP